MLGALKGIFADGVAPSAPGLICGKPRLYITLFFLSGTGFTLPVPDFSTGGFYYDSNRFI